MNKHLKINYSLHNHTKRCGHAYMDDKDYVNAAIDSGYLYYGFSDHCMFPDLKKEDCGRDYSLFTDYVESVNLLKEEYKEKIDILLGFEAEYDKNHENFYQELFSKYGFDYLICGQHYYIENHKAKYYFNKMDDMPMIQKYKNDVIEAIRSGFFTYIAHPDIFFNSITKVTDEVIKICEEIVLAAIEHNVLLEINLGGMRCANLNAQLRGGLPYPNRAFFEVVKKYNAKVIIGVDAHAPGDLNDERYLNFARRFVKELDLNEVKNFEDIIFRKR